MTSNVWVVARTAAEPVIKVCLVSAAGWVCALPRCGILTKSSKTSLSQLNVNVLLPAFLFMRMVKTASIDVIIKWWTLPFFVGMNLSFGLVLGWLLLHLTGDKVPGPQRGVVLAVTAIGNCGILPLALVPAACAPAVRPLFRPLGTELDCVEEAQGMAAFGLWMCTIAIWSLGTRLLKKPEETEGDLESAQSASNPYAEMGSISGHGETTMHVKGEEACQPSETLPSAQAPTSSKGTSEAPQAQAPAETTMPAVLAIMGVSINPPLAAMFLGVFCGVLPMTRGLFVGSGAPLSFVSATLEVLGDAFMSAMLLVLGANMPSPAQFRDTRGTFSGGRAVLRPEIVSLTVAVRLMVLPVLGIGLHWAFTAAGLLPSDPLLNFVILLQFTAPTAANLGTVATYQGHGAAEVSQVALQQYLFAVPCVTCFMMYYLSLF